MHVTVIWLDVHEICYMIVVFATGHHRHYNMYFVNVQNNISIPCAAQTDGKYKHNCSMS